jgi:hypothetical protein
MVQHKCYFALVVKKKNHTNDDDAYTLFLFFDQRNMHDNNKHTRLISFLCIYARCEFLIIIIILENYYVVWNLI